MRSFLVPILFWCLTGFLAAQTGVPELDALKNPYTASVTALRKARDERAGPFAKNYLAALDRLEKQMPAIAAAVKAERDRLIAGQPLTDALRQAMPAALADVYTRFAADVQKSDAPFTQQEQQLGRQYLSALDNLQRRLLAQNEIAKAAQVRTERDTVAASIPGAPAAPGTKEEHTPAASTIRSGTGRAATALDPSLATKITNAIAGKQFERTTNTGEDADKPGWADTPGGLLVGFEFFEVGKDNHIRSMRPYFLTAEGVVAGKDRGKMDKVTSKVLARPGFAVGGIIGAGNKGGLQIIFMRIDPATGKLATDSSSTYKSPWFGDKNKAKPLPIGADGSPVIGVYGKTGADCDGIGLVILK